MDFKTNYKDEIPADGKRLYGLVDKNGAYVNRDVQIVRTNANTQEGDTFGAEEVNKIGNFLNGVSNENIIINGDLQVWQRGENIEVNNGVKYGPDRIRIWENGTNIGVIRIKTDDGKGKGLHWYGKVGSIIYKFDQDDFNKYEGKTITISYSVNKVVRIYKTIVCTSPILFDYNFNMVTGDVLNYIKAEIGQYATLNVPRPYADVLTGCLRYYESGVYPVCALSGTYFVGGFSYRAAKRIKPTIIIDNTNDENGVIAGAFQPFAQNLESCPFIHKDGGYHGLGNKTMTLSLTIDAEDYEV